MRAPRTRADEMSIKTGESRCACCTAAELASVTTASRIPVELRLADWRRVRTIAYQMIAASLNIASREAAFQWVTELYILTQEREFNKLRRDRLTVALKRIFTMFKQQPTLEHRREQLLKVIEAKGAARLELPEGDGDGDAHTEEFLLRATERYKMLARTEILLHGCVESAINCGYFDLDVAATGHFRFPECFSFCAECCPVHPGQRRFYLLRDMLALHHETRQRSRYEQPPA